MAKHNDLKVLPSSRTYSETSELSEEAVEETRHEKAGWRVKLLISAHARVFERHTLNLAAKDLELVAQHDDLEILRSPRPDREPVGAEYCVVAGQAAFRYSLMRPSHWVDFRTRRWR